MIVEHPLVTKSHLIIKKAASAQSFLDDATSVEEKIASFFNEQIEVINENKLKALEEEKEAEKAAEDETK